MNTIQDIIMNKQNANIDKFLIDIAGKINIVHKIRIGKQKQTILNDPQKVKCRRPRDSLMNTLQPHYSTCGS